MCVCVYECNNYVCVGVFMSVIIACVCVCVCARIAPVYLFMFIIISFYIVYHAG